MHDDVTHLLELGSGEKLKILILMRASPADRDRQAAARVSMLHGDQGKADKRGLWNKGDCKGQVRCHHDVNGRLPLNPEYCVK